MTNFICETSKTFTQFLHLSLPFLDVAQISIVAACDLRKRRQIDATKKPGEPGFFVLSDTSY